MNSLEVPSAVVCDQPPFKGVDDHLAHRGMVVDIEPVIPVKYDLSRVDDPLFDPLPPQLAMYEGMPILGVGFALSPVLPRPIGVEPVLLRPSSLLFFGGGIGDHEPTDSMMFLTASIHASFPPQ